MARARLGPRRRAPGVGGALVAARDAGGDRGARRRRLDAPVRQRRGWHVRGGARAAPGPPARAARAPGESGAAARLRPATASLDRARRERRGERVNAWSPRRTWHEECGVFAA